jgi:hypothetical protein
MAGRLGPDALQYYLGLGPGRSYQAVAHKFGVSKRAVTALAVKERWQERVAEVEREAQATAVQRAIETLEAMNDRHLKALRVIQAKALQALREMPLSTAMEAVRALDLAIRQERTIRGEPSERTAVSVEEVIRSEYERWLSFEEPEEDQDEAEAEERPT